MAEEGNVVRLQFFLFLLLAFCRRWLFALRTHTLLDCTCSGGGSWRNRGLLAEEGLGLEVKRGGKKDVAKTGEEGEDDVGQRVHGGLLEELG